MLRPRFAARFTRRPNMLIRVHLLRRLHHRQVAWPLPELQRRIGPKADPAGRQVGLSARLGDPNRQGQRLWLIGSARSLAIGAKNVGNSVNGMRISPRMDSPTRSAGLTVCRTESRRRLLQLRRRFRRLATPSEATQTCLIPSVVSRCGFGTLDRRLCAATETTSPRPNACSHWD